MLHFFRKHSSSIIVRIILGAIALSFCFWGLGSLSKNNPIQEKVVAYMGEDPLSFKTIASQMNEAAPADHERESVYTEILTRQIRSYIIYQEAKRLELQFPDALLRQSIRSIPFLHTSQGQFDSEKLQALLSNGAIKKDALLAYAYSTLTNKQISTIFLGQELYPAAHALRLFSLVHAPLDLNLYVIQTHKAAEMQTLEKSFFSSEDFATFLRNTTQKASTSFVLGVSVPATCRIRALHISPKAFRVAQKISSADIDQALQERFPKRVIKHVSYIVAPTKDKVEEGIKLIKANGQIPDSIQITKHFLHSDQESTEPWAKQANPLPKGGHSVIQKTSDANSFECTFIEDISFEDTAPKDTITRRGVKDELTLLRAQAAADALRAQIESETTSLDAALKMAGPAGQLIETQPLTRQGLTLSGLSAEKLYSLKLDKEAMDSIFSAPINELDTPITLSDGTHLFFVTLESKPAQTLSKDSANLTPIKMDFLREKMPPEISRQAAKISQELTKAGKEDPAALGYGPSYKKELRKQSVLALPYPLSLEDRMSILALKKGEHAVVMIGSMPHIVKVTHIGRADPSSHLESYKKFKGFLQDSMSKDMQNAWTRSLYSQHKVSIIAPTLKDAEKLT